ncbi:MAG TPA: carboxymuconolactone decarboxylase family protein [Steroidobacteraceae bacterium]|nr:carboxymuconolactone decarboxylase family protein [Steroidobacteraceae bacterium]
MTTRIPTPASIAAAPEASRALLEGVKKQLGVAPNLFRMVANSPAALQGYVGLLGALGHGALTAATHERIALAIAEFNSCDYCLSAHTYLGKNVAKLDDSEIAANRNGTSHDERADAAVRFALKVAQLRGQVGDDDVRGIRAAGYTDGEIVEIVQHVALNTWTNYVNNVARTEIDFPVVTARRVA